ncbi:MAG TPA: DNA methyltransferase [Roseomonas sp.]|jgi:hypothetical protein
MRRPIVNHVEPGGLVYEPFMGSGTTVIAAESVNRVCRGVELDPAYVDVVVRRWQAFTGRDAVLADCERSFAEVARARLAGSSPGSRLSNASTSDLATPAAPLTSDEAHGVTFNPQL